MILDGDAAAADRRGRGGWRAGQILRLTDTTGRACVSALFYNARDPLERYNMADTLKAQYTAFLTAGRVLYSDMGRVLASIIAGHLRLARHHLGVRRRRRRRGALRSRALPGAAQRFSPQRARQLRRRAVASAGSASATSWRT